MYKSTSGQHSLRKDAIALSRGLLSRGTVCANVYAYVMYAAFLVRPGALGSPQLRKFSGTSIHEMKGDRDGKSAKTSAKRNCL